MDITNGMTLSSAIKDKSTPLSHYLRNKFPETRALQQDYKARVGPLIVDTEGAPFGTLGTAVDLLVRFLLDPTDRPQSARARFPLNETFLDAVDELIAIAAREESDNQDRAVWALALCVEAWRAGNRFPSVVADLVNNGQFDTTTMLAQAPAAALVELAALRTLTSERLIPNLAEPFHLGPEFDSSKPGKGQRIAAEADLICAGLLLDIKTQLGAKNSAGIRIDTLDATHLYQLLAYALLDHSNTYGIDKIGLYSARYGALVVWPLEHVTSTMAGQTVDFAALRQEIRDMLYA